METTTAKPATEKGETAEKGGEKRYVIDKTTGKRISKAWQAMLDNVGTGEILDMKAVVEGLYR